MRKLTFAFLLLSGTLWSCNSTSNDVRTDDVPAAVRDALQSSFQNAADIEWEKNGADFEADFEIDRTDHTALFNASGTLLKHKYNITEAQLPEAIRSAITQNHADHKIDDPEVVVQDGDTLYQVELDHTTSADQKLVFSSAGQQVEQTYWD